jgi:uncharacterized protein (TIGR03435 family)
MNIHSIAVVGSLLFFAIGCFGQAATTSTFAVASLKKSAQAAGRDARGAIVIGADRVSARNVSLKDLLVAAHHLEPYQVSGPGWLDSDEFDMDARADGPVSQEQLRLMLQNLLSERFQLSLHRYEKEVATYALVIDRNGPKIQPAPQGTKAGERSAPAAGRRSFHGDMRQLANLLSVQLSIPAVSDPTRPSIATASPVPVIDKTGLPGSYDFSVDFRPEPDTDMFQLWQRILQDRLGLKLENRKVQAQFLVVDRAARIPLPN